MNTKLTQAQRTQNTEINRLTRLHTHTPIHAIEVSEPRNCAVHRKVTPPLVVVVPVEEGRHEANSCRSSFQNWDRWGSLASHRFSATSNRVSSRKLALLWIRGTCIRGTGNGKMFHAFSYRKSLVSTPLTLVKPLRSKKWPCHQAIISHFTGTRPCLHARYRSLMRFHC